MMDATQKRMAKAREKATTGFLNSPNLDSTGTTPIVSPPKAARKPDNQEESPSPTKKYKTSVSPPKAARKPNNQEESPSPKKKKKLSNFFKGSDEGLPFLNNLTTPVEAKIVFRSVLDELLTLYYVNNFYGNEEGKTFSILRSLGMVRLENDEPLDYYDRKFAQESKFMAVSSRRAGKFENFPLMKTSAKDRKYKQVVFVKALSNNCPSNRRAFALKMAQFLNHKGVLTEVKEDADLTDEVQSLDHYLLDADILRIIETFSRTRIGKNWYGNNPELRDLFFSRPYPDIAINELGYPKPTHNIEGQFNEEIPMTQASDNDEENDLPID